MRKTGEKTNSDTERKLRTRARQGVIISDSVYEERICTQKHVRMGGQMGDSKKAFGGHMKLKRAEREQMND